MNLKERLLQIIENCKARYSSSEAILALQKTFQTHNITIEDWNSLIDYVKVAIDTNNDLIEIIDAINEVAQFLDNALYLTDGTKAGEGNGTITEEQFNNINKNTVVVTEWNCIYRVIRKESTPTYVDWIFACFPSGIQIFADEYRSLRIRCTYGSPNVYTYEFYALTDYAMLGTNDGFTDGVGQSGSIANTDLLDKFYNRDTGGYVADFKIITEDRTIYSLCKVSYYDNPTFYQYNREFLFIHQEKADATSQRVLQIGWNAGDAICYYSFSKINIQTGMTNPMTTSQDIIVGGVSGAPSRLAKGNTGELLRVNSSGNLAYGKNLPIVTTAPSADNTDGLIICVLDSEPATKYNGYLYIITGSNNS